MNILSCDTSTHRFSCAVSKNGKILVSVDGALKSVLSSSIIPSIKKILKKARLSLTKIDGFAVGLGPGSFTSLRVGLSTVKGLAFALAKPVVGVVSLDALAIKAGQKEQRPICTLCDARRDLVYSCLYEICNGQLVRKMDYSLLGVKALMGKIKDGTFFIGDGINILRRDLGENFREKKFFFAPEKDWYPQAKEIARLAYQRFLDKSWDDADHLTPLYLYPEDCQVRK